MTLNLKASLAGFNMSKRSNRESVEDFITSYLLVYPDRAKLVAERIDALYDWIDEMLAAKQRPLRSQPPKGSTLAPVKQKAPAKLAWVPKTHYIPEYANPRASFKWQGMRIARDMRLKIERD